MRERVKSGRRVDVGTAAKFVESTFGNLFARDMSARETDVCVCDVGGIGAEIFEKIKILTQRRRGAKKTRTDFMVRVFLFS